MMVRNILVLLVLLVLSKAAFADFTGYIKAGESNLYVEYIKAASEEKPTFVLINGLVYEVERWGQVAKELSKEGFGVIRYELEGQYRSYVRSMEDNDGAPEWYKNGIKLENQALQLKEILTALEINKPVQVVGLSYGASVAATFASEYPESVAALTFMSPLIIPMENYNPQGRALRRWLDLLDSLGPIGSYWSEYYYDMIYQTYMQSLPSGRTYHLGKWEKDYNMAVFQQVKSVRYFDMREFDYSKGLQGKKINLVTASKEQIPLLKDQLNMWNVWPQGLKGALIHVDQAGHDIPNRFSNMVSSILTAIGNDEDYLKEGQTFKAQVKRGKNVIEPTPIDEL